MEKRLSYCEICGKPLANQNSGKCIVIKSTENYPRQMLVCDDCFKEHKRKNTIKYLCSQFLKSVNSEFNGTEKQIIEDNEDLFNKVVKCTCARIYNKFKSYKKIESAILDADEYVITCILAGGDCTSDT